MFGTPIVHYEPERMARGRVALAGDAAPAEIPAALGRYQALGLRPAAQHVAVSERATVAYLAQATR